MRPGVTTTMPRNDQSDLQTNLKPIVSQTALCWRCFGGLAKVYLAGADVFVGLPDVHLVQENALCSYIILTFGCASGFVFIKQGL